MITNGDGSADDAVNSCLSDNDSDGVFNVLEISADATTYGQSVSGNLLTMDNDVRVAGPVNNPALDSPDFRIRSKSWYVGTIGLVENFKFVLWDLDSDGVFENLVFDSNRNDNYADETQYTSLLASITLRPRRPYVCRVLEFSPRSPYTDPDLWMQPLDNSPPELENLEPAQGAFVNTRSPVIRARIWWSPQPTP